MHCNSNLEAKKLVLDVITDLLPANGDLLVWKTFFFPPC